jgi:CBS domain containing-hemolysin-like protein
MAFAGLNYVAIVVAAVAGWLIGTALHWPFTRERPKKVQPLVLAFTACLIMAWVLAGVLGHLGPGQVTLRNGVISAAFLWFGFVLTTTVVNNTVANRSLVLTGIDVGHWLIVLLAMGAIIGAIGLR